MTETTKTILATKEQQKIIDQRCSVAYDSLGVAYRLMLAGKIEAATEKATTISQKLGEDVGGDNFMKFCFARREQIASRIAEINKTLEEYYSPEAGPERRREFIEKSEREIGGLRSTNDYILGIASVINTQGAQINR